MSILTKTSSTLFSRSPVFMRAPVTLGRVTLGLRNLATTTDAPLHGGSTNGVSTIPTADQNIKATLRLQSGQAFKGISFGAARSVAGETVFTTSLVGYPESMTDPSYCGQILVFTQPLIGNYGVPASTRDEFGLLRYFESERIQVSGIVVSDYAQRYSHWNAVESLASWCARNGVPAISGVDTRALVHTLRAQGSTLGQLSVDTEQLSVPWDDPNTKNLVKNVSVREPMVYNASGDVRIALIDCGVKHNIIRSLVKRGASVTVLPWDYNVSPLAHHFDGLFISNGPGNPEMATNTVNNVRAALHTFSDKPIFGICMGNQILGLAAGMRARKLPFGNRGHNQPAVNTRDGRCVITSQNHGYALCDAKMPTGWHRYFVNANDGSNEGIWHESGLASSVQFHPEAKGGPMDTEYLFEDFLTSVRAEKTKRVDMRIWAGKKAESRVAVASGSA